MGAETAYDSWPTAICSCGTSLHDYPRDHARPSARDDHQARRHSDENPAEYVALVDQSTHGDLVQAVA